ncbi:MAG: cytochrome oxidase putative small subunit CydP [Steroidobacteraceae bacterium]
MKKSLSLQWKMGLILAAKLIALMGIYFLFFSPAHRVKVDSAQVQGRFYSSDVNDLSGEQ